MNALAWLIMSFQLTFPYLQVAIVDFIFQRAMHMVMLAPHSKMNHMRNNVWKRRLPPVVKT